MRIYVKLLLIATVLSTMVIVSAGEPEAQISAPNPSPPLDVIVIQKPGCRSCAKLEDGIARLIRECPNKVRIFKYRIEDDKAKVLCEALCIKYGVPDKLHLATPAVFFSSKYFIGEESVKKEDVTGEIIRCFQNPDSMPTPYFSTDELLQAERAIQNRFMNIRLAAVLAAGLIDGVNPCAFVTIIFLFSYLALLKFGKRDVILVGLAFAGAIFATYLLIGLGFIKVVSILGDVGGLSRAIYYATAMLAFIAGILNLYDFFRIKKGDLADITFKLGDGLRRRINTVIRKNLKLGHFVLGAMIIGFSVSILELACTGQTYAPTVLFILSTQGMNWKAIMMLVLYNLAFIVPLLAVIILYSHGVGDKDLSAWLTRHGAKIKLATGIIFILIGIIVLSLRF